MSVRLDKVSSLIKEEISLIFLHKIQDPAFGLITITGVKLSPDLRNAKIYVSIYEKEKRDVLLQKVNDIKGYIKSQLAQRIRNLRFIPDLAFYIDDTLDYVEKMDGLFKEIHKNDNKSDE